MNQPAVIVHQSLAASRDWLVIQLAELLEESLVTIATLEDHDDLLSCGMDSIRLMYLCERLRRQGYEISLSDLSRTPTLAAWVELLAAQEAPNENKILVSPNIVVDPEEAFDLTPVQQAYWLGRSASEVLGNISCHAFLQFRVRNIDPHRMKQACLLVRDRHPMLRTRFIEGRQQLTDVSSIAVFDHQDWREVTLTAAQAYWDALVRHRSHECLDVARGQVFLVGLAQMPNGEDRIWLSLDLLAADVESLRLLLAEIGQAYTAPAAMQPVPQVNFAEYLVRRDKRLQPERDAAMRWWREQLPTLPTGPELPLACSPDAIGAPRFHRTSYRLSAMECHRLEHKAAEHGVTLASVFGCVFAAVLARWSERQDFLLNVPLFDRHEAGGEVDRVIADFTNLVLVPCEVKTTVTVGQAVRAFQNAMHEAISHSAYPAIEVLRDARRQGIARNAPVVYSCNLGRDAFIPDEFQHAFGDLYDMISQTPQVWLDHQLYRVDCGILLAWDSVEGLFPSGVMQEMFDAYVSCIQRLCDQDWDRELVVELPWRQQCYRAQRNAVLPVSRARLIHEDFFDQAAREPNMPALWFHGQMTSRGELADQALRVASGLQSAGVGYGDAVEISLPRGSEQVAAVLGVLAAGACYVPIDQSQPTSRHRLIATSAEVKVIIGESACGSSSARYAFDALAAFTPLPHIMSVPTHASAYVIYTSGSTGVPKGVEVSHAAAANTIYAVRDILKITPDDRLLALSALDFDLSVFDIFGTLGAGASLVLLEQDEARDAVRWGALAQHHQVTLWNSAPALLEMILAAPDAAAGLCHVRAGLLSGDWIALDLPEKLRTHAATQCAIYALGGATEAGIWSNIQSVQDVPAQWRTIPYGIPLPGQAYRVVDAAGRDVPDYVAGQLLIGGVSLARGYRNDPHLTEQRFFMESATRWYRTGDRGRYWADGTLEFLGRVDQQVKVRGVRIELGEIESVLDAHTSITRSCATVLPGAAPTLAAVVVPTMPATDPLTAWAREEMASTWAAEIRATRAVIERVLASSSEVPAARAAKWQQWLEDDTNRVDISLVDALNVLGWQEEWVDMAVAKIADVMNSGADARQLLFDARLAPQAVAINLPVGRRALRDTATLLAERVRQSIEPLRIAVLDVRAGQVLAPLMEVLDAPNVKVTLFEASSSLLMAAKAAFTRSAPATRCVFEGWLPANCAAQFDCVISYTALHTYDDLRDGIWFAVSLLAPGGDLYISEVLRDSPLRQLGAALWDEPLDDPRSFSYKHPSDFMALCAEAGLAVGEASWCTEAFAFGHLRAIKTVLAESEVRQWLADNLPATMHPEALWYRRTLALNANGKIDRRGLNMQMAERVDIAVSNQTSFQPANPQETGLLDCWCEVLGPQAGVDDASFFSLGGDSLLATRLLANLRSRLGVRISMADFYRQPTLPGLASHLKQLVQNDVAQLHEEGTL